MWKCHEFSMCIVCQDADLLVSCRTREKLGEIRSQSFNSPGFYLFSGNIICLFFLLFFFFVCFNAVKPNSLWSLSAEKQIKAVKILSSSHVKVVAERQMLRGSKLTPLWSWALWISLLKNLLLWVIETTETNLELHFLGGRPEYAGYTTAWHSLTNEAKTLVTAAVQGGKKK